MTLIGTMTKPGGAGSEQTVSLFASGLSELVSPELTCCCRRLLRNRRTALRICPGTESCSTFKTRATGFSSFLR